MAPADLFRALSEDNLFSMIVELGMGSDINTLNHDQKTALWIAVEEGKEAFCELLVTRGAQIEVHGTSILNIAVQRGNARIVKLLWPFCNPTREYLALESAISLGFHEIADFLIDTGEFRYLNVDFNARVSFQGEGFPVRSPLVVEEWGRFIEHRDALRLLNVNRKYFAYALLLAAKAEHSAGATFVEFLLVKRLVDGRDASDPIKIHEQYETPLIAAAARGDLRVLALLTRQPNIDLTIRGPCDVPAIIYVLTNISKILTEEDRAVARRLSSAVAPFSISFGSPSCWSGLNTVIEYVLGTRREDLIKTVIDIVREDAGMSILPLLISINDFSLFMRLLNVRELSSSNPTPYSWVLLARYLGEFHDAGSLILFGVVAFHMIKSGIWKDIVWECLSSKNSLFMQQFFIPPTMVPPSQVTNDTLISLREVGLSQSLIEHWSQGSYADIALWKALRCELCNGPNIQLLVIYGANPNALYPHNGVLEGEKLYEPFHPFFTETFVPSFSSALDLTTGPNPFNPFIILSEPAENIDFQRLRPLTWAILAGKLLLVDILVQSLNIDVNIGDLQGRTPLMYGVARKDVAIVKRLLQCEGIDINVQDHLGRSAIFYAEEARDPETAKVLVSSQNFDPLVHNLEGHTVKDLATCHGNHEVLQVISRLQETGGREGGSTSV